MALIRISPAGGSPVGVDVRATSMGVGWNQVVLGVTNHTGEPVSIGLQYVDGPSDIIYIHLADGDTNLSLMRDESTDIGLVFDVYTIRLLIYFKLPGTHTFKLLWRKSYESEFREAGTIEFEVSGKPSSMERIDPWDERLYQTLKDGKPIMVITLTGISKSDTGDYYLYYMIYDRETGKAYSPVYLASEIIKPKSGTDNVVLSPLALQALLQLKEYSKDKYVTLFYNTSFKFNAYAEFFKNLFSGHPEDARTWFEQRIQEMVLKALQKNGIPVRSVWVYSLKLNYDTVGIVTGTNPNVTVEAGIGMTIDPAVPWWLIGMIIAGAIIAIVGYEVYMTITIHDIETTKQEYYKTLQSYADAWAEYEKAYQKWLSLPPSQRQSIKPPSPPSIPQPKSPGQIKIPTTALPGLPSIPWSSIATILALIVGGAIAYKFLSKK